MRNKTLKVTVLLLFTLPLLLSAHGVGSSQVAYVSYSTTQTLVEDRGAFITISEVQPIPAGDEPEWVELRTHAFAIYLPMVQTSGSGMGSSGPLESTGVAPRAVGGPLDFSGWEITDGDGNIYVIPEALPSAPHNSYVLVIFDGQGEAADDYDFSDGVAELHTPPGLVNIFENDADQVALYRGETIVDFVAYGGDAGGDDDAAVATGMWSDGFYIGPTIQVPGGEVLMPSGSVGWFSEEDNNSSDEWVIYRANETTPGADNVPPAPFFRTPPDGIETSDHTIPFGWSTLAGAVGYHFQLSTTSDFSDLLIDDMTPASAFIPESDIPDGTYYYRVRAEQANGSFSAFSEPGEVTIVTIEGSLTVQVSNVLNVTPQLQHKDSRMLCVDGHQRTGNDRWDSAHENDGDWVVGNGTPLRTNPHDDNYCTRASISMVVDFHGGSLSQDRISYYHYDGGPPDGDLGHGIGLWPDEMCTFGTGTAGDDDVFRWAMNGGTNDCSRGKPTFTQVRNWIDAGRPCLFVENNDQHSTVMDGYDTNGNMVHRIDPWTATASWVSFASWNVSEYHCPAVGTPRSDEASFALDSDGDGVTDFDEINRFDTSPITPDFEEDWVNDKWDIYEVYFNAAGNHSPKAGGADMDSDSLRKEVDPDNDGGGTVDGCEDSDADGRFDTGETNNYNASDDTACVPVFDIRSPLQSVPGEVGDKSSPDKLMVRVLAAVPPAAWPFTLSTSDFSVSIGGTAASILVPPYGVGDEFWLMVQPPTKSTAGYYDLKVTLQGTQTDTETKAVHYSDKARQPIDEVLVFDNSGSMSLYNKMVSAKNAGRAFIDQWKVNDMVSVVAFSTTVSTPFPLTTVTGTATLTNARSAVNSMLDSPPGDWYTAIGKGLLEAKKQLTGGGAGHSQSIVLLGDGMENESPLWSDPSSGVQTAFQNCSIKVHTVAIGPSQSSWRYLLQDISQKACNGDGLAWNTSGGASSPTVTSVQTNGFPDSLSNRLADIYLSIVEDDTRDQRLWEATNNITQDAFDVYQVSVPGGLPEVIWTLNWDVGTVELRLYDPNGDPVDPTDPRVEHLQDVTHDQYRIETPLAGMWQVEAHNIGNTPSSEYLAVLSGHSDVVLWLYLGLIPIDRAVDMVMPIHVALADNDAIVGAVVTATIMAPQEDLPFELRLQDDGHHGDGNADDGLYGEFFHLGYPGSYTIKAVATGYDNNGEPFERYLTRSFYVRPRVAYIFNAEDPAKADAAFAYSHLLADNGFIPHLIPLGDITASTNFEGFELILVGPGTGELDTWGTPDALNAILNSNKPIIGLGEGGYAFFGQLGLAIGFPHGWHGNETGVYAVNPDSELWSEPYLITIPQDQIVTIYTTTDQVGIELPTPPEDVTLIGREINDSTHYSIVQQTWRYLLWGFDGPPEAMTATGKDLFVNLLWYME